MATTCYAMVRGSALRVSEVDKRGFAPDPVRYATSKSVAEVTINEVIESGGTEVLRSPSDEPRLRFVKPDQLIRYQVDVSFLRVDPGLLSLVAGVPLVHNADGVVVGFDSTDRIAPTPFALEVWSRLAGQACAPTTGQGFGESEFGESGFGQGAAGGPVLRQYGYTLFPLLKGGVLSGFEFSDGLVSFSLKNAKTQKGSEWGFGPYDGLLDTPVSGNTAWRSFVTTVGPPDQVDGVHELWRLVEGGDASTTTADILDGEFAVTGSGIVDGGTAQ